MEKQTLKFLSLRELSTFVKPLLVGYFINTNTFTITARFPDQQIKQSIYKFNARLIETNESIYGYDGEQWQNG